MSAPQLERLAAELSELFGESPRPEGKRVAQLLAGYATSESDWEPWALFTEGGYTRNRVVREERFELLLLAWGAGQESPIHNHGGQDCWMGVLSGRIEELRYPLPAPGGKGPLELRQSQVYAPGEVAFIRDEIGLHLVRSAHDAPAVSLHLYAAPYDHCNVYCPDTGEITRRKLSDYSHRGQLLTQERV